MPVYFFHLRDGQDVLLDPDGRELPSLEEAAGEALREARAIIGADATRGRINLGYRLDIENADGALLHRLDFGDALEIVWAN